MWEGKLVRESTKQGSDKKARNEESKHRARLVEEKKEREKACERLGCSNVLRCHECEKLFNAEKAIKEGNNIFCSNGCSSAWYKKHIRVPTLGEFLKELFLPFTESQSRTSKPKTADYYRYGVSLLLECDLANVKLNEITSQHGGEFIATHQSRLCASTQNCGLRTLRRALNLAYEWDKLERPVKIKLAKGERRRERVVSEAEFLAYRELCRQPWRDVTTLLYGTGMRPGEVYALQWEHVLLGVDKGMIQVAEGKSKAARRLLPMVPEVFNVLLARWESQNRPTVGWVFPAGSKSGHVEESAAKIQHGDALKKLAAAKAVFDQWAKDGGQGDWQAVVEAKTKIGSDFLSKHSEIVKVGLKPFEPYCLRHTALTRLADSGCDAFTLARIAGHSSISITERYCHPQAEAIERAFRKISGGHRSGHNQNLLLPADISKSN
jgi:integrase